MCSLKNKLATNLIRAIIAVLFKSSTASFLFLLFNCKNNFNNNMRTTHSRSHILKSEAKHNTSITLMAIPNTTLLEQEQQILELINKKKKKQQQYKNQTNKSCGANEF